MDEITKKKEEENITAKNPNNKLSANYKFVSNLWLISNSKTNDMQIVL